MKNFSRILGLLLLCLSGIAAYNKDYQSLPINKTELLAGKSAKTWRAVTSTKNSTHLLSSGTACNQDDYFIFRADKTFEANEGATKCSPSGPQVFGSGLWAFNKEESAIVVDGEEYRLAELTATKLSLSFTDGNIAVVETYVAE